MLVLAAPCFWWLDHYRHFATRLHETARSCRTTALAMVFELE